ncbi:MAG TPA: rhodanese-like domain-containing protein [Anaerolineae bacterium]
MIQQISTQELAQNLENPNFAVVDVRPIAAYNGWPLQGEARGGHIRGAVACPLAWTGLLKPWELEALLADKGVTLGKTVVVYGYSAEDSTAAAKALATLGYENVVTYDAGLAEWAANPDLALDRLPKYEKLVHPRWLHELIHARAARNGTGPGLVIGHVTFGVPEEYGQGHIPGAIHLDTLALESPETWNRRSADELNTALLAHGITRDTKVVLYGRDSDPTMRDEHPGRKAGQIAATRAAAILMYAGVEDVRLLDGGFHTWLAAGYDVETAWRAPVPAADFGTQIPARPDYIIDIDEARALLNDPNGVLVSIRSWREFAGEVSGYHYIGRRGRIAGAVWGNCGSDAYHMQHYRNVDNTMREYHEIEANWREAGITADKQVAFYCGTGWRASETFFYAYLLDWTRIAVYDGGWFEWSQDSSNPVEIGVPAYMQHPKVSYELSVA